MRVIRVYIDSEPSRFAFGLNHVMRELLLGAWVELISVAMLFHDVLWLFCYEVSKRILPLWNVLT